MRLANFRHFLLDRGMVRVYAFFLLGYFILPMSGTLQKVFYALVLPATLLIARELAEFYRGNRLFQLFLAFNAYMLATLAWTADFDASEAVEILWNSINQFAFVCVSGYLWVKHPETLGKALHLLVWAAGIAAVVSMLVVYSQNPFPSTRLDPIGVIHHSNKAACVYGMLLLLVAHYLMDERSRGTRVAHAGLALVMLTLILLTQSRTGLAALLVGALVLFGFRALGLALVCFALSWALLATNPDIWWFRVSNLSYRPQIWSQQLSEMAGHWWFGHGILVDESLRAGKYGFSHTHNSYLATLRDGGVVGLSLLAALLGTALYQAVALYRQNRERMYMCLVLFGMTCVFMDFDRLFTKPKEQWLFLWLPLALVMALYPRREQLGPVRRGLYSS